jgi:hypothetical protein
MKKNVKSVKNSLKFKAQPKSGALSVRVGVKKYALPVEARILSSEGYMFLSFPANSELYRVEGKNLSPMDPNEDATEAAAALTPATQKPGRRKRENGVDMPGALAEALRQIPPGYRLGYGADGTPRLVRTRRRRGG